MGQQIAAELWPQLLDVLDVQKRRDVPDWDDQEGGERHAQHLDDVPAHEHLPAAQQEVVPRDIEGGWG